MKFGIGQPVSRIEDTRFLRGAGAYLDDITLPDQAHASVLRSPVAHGTIRELDVSSARAMDGVLAVWTYTDIATRLAPIRGEMPLTPAPADVTWPHLADGRVRYVGQPVAIVFADSRALADDALDAIVVDFDELDAVTDPVAALEENAPQLHDNAPGNLAYDWQCGDQERTDAFFAAPYRVVSTPILNQRVVVASMEPRGANVRYDAETERWEAWVSTQGAHGMRGKLARALGVEADRVRVHVPDVGGAFGMKLMNHPEYALCALAAHDLRRPVKWIGSRSESFLSDCQGRDMRGTLDGAFDADGVCHAIRMRSISGVGAYFSTAGAAVHTLFSASLLGGLYKVKAIHARVRGAFTNTPSTDAYRGAGRPETIHATERLIDAAATELDINPVEIRRRNLITTDMIPHGSAGGFTFDSLDTHKILDRALVSSDHAGFEARASAAKARGAHSGIGVAYYMERTGGAPLESTRMEIGTDGKLRIWIGTQTSGQGHETAWAQIVHEQLGIPPDRIEVMAGDSDALEVGGGTGGSRSAVMASRALLKGSEDLIEQAHIRASEHLEAAPGDLEFSTEDGGLVRVAGTDRSVTLAELAATDDLRGFARIDGATPTFPNGCHIAEVEIDGDTGMIEITRYTAIDDFGRIINPELVMGQIHGGVVQGIGQMIGEQAIWDGDTGQPLTGSFMDYQMPRASDVPFFDIKFEEVLCQTNPLGVKGCGEAGAVGGIASMAMAVRDALRRAGADPIEAPFTPLRVWQALNS